MPSPPLAGEILSLNNSGFTNTVTVLAAQNYDFWVKSFILEVQTAGTGGATVKLNGSVSGDVVFQTEVGALKSISHTFGSGFFLPAGDALQATVSNDGTFNTTVEVLAKVAQNWQT